MSRAFKLPDLGEGIHEAEVVAILVKEGDVVKEGQPFIEVETDKARVELPSPFAGTVEEIKVKQDDSVKVGTVLVVFGEGDAASSSKPVEQATAAESGPVPAKREDEPAPSPGAPPERASPSPPSAGARGNGSPVPASPATRRLARELGVDLRQVAPSGPAGLVTAQDVRSFAERGLQKTQEEVASTPQAAQSPTEIEEAAMPVMPPASPGETVSLPDFGRWGIVEKVPLRSVRRATARHMALAWSQVPHVNHQDVADITKLELYRREHKVEIEAAGGQLTTTVFAMKAVVAALKAHPRLNCSLDPRAEEIILKHYYHIGVAVDTERGLVVPVVRDVDRKSLTELAVELKGLAERARTGETPLEEMLGGTFTITNIGALGGTGFSPIVNYPEVAIMGMGRARLQPVVMGDENDYQIVPRLMMPLVLAFDHRVLDGADAARFMGMVIEGLENPDKLWLRI